MEFTWKINVDANSSSSSSSSSLSPSLAATATTIRSRGRQFWSHSWRSGPAPGQIADSHQPSQLSAVAEDNTPDVEPTLSIPIQLLPFQFEKPLSSALSLFVQDVVPSLYRRREVQHAGVDSLFLRDVLSFVLSNEAAYYSRGAVSLIILDFVNTGTARLTPAVCYLLNKSYVALHKTLSQGQSSLDATIWAIEALIGVDILLGLYERAVIHLSALRGLLRTYGGYESLGFDGFLARTVKSYFGHFRAMRSLQSQRKVLRSKTQAGIPIAFSDMTNAGTISQQCILLLESVSADTTTQSTGVHLAQCIKLLRDSHNLNDFLIGLALMAFCTHRCGRMEIYWLDNCYIQLLCKSLMARNFRDCDPDLMMWAGRILRAVYGPENMTCALADRLIATAIAQYDASGANVPNVRDCQRYFWDDSLTENLKRI